ncbi:Protein Y71G12B.26 [Aphelenchoides avenae]|nr:Protein Y71G12B.26 [Aphelenchus avenae]
MPTIVDALIGQLVGEDGDDKERSQLLMRLTIPQGIAFAAGPFAAIQVLYLFNPTLEFSQTLCGILHLVTILPIIIYVLPEQEDGQRTERYLPSARTYLDILSNSNLLWTLVFVMFVAGPYSAYDQVLRLHLSSHMLTQPADMSKMAFLLGVTAFVANVYVLPRLQQKLGPQQLLQLSLVILAGSYLYLSQAGGMSQNKFYLLLIGVPFQVIGTCMAVGQLSAQILSSVPRSHMGKAAALNRIAQLAATTMTPIITGHYIDFEETSTLCYVSTAITVLAIPLVQKYGTFMRQHFVNLPMRGHKD